jgi:hypothetical protein
MHLDIKKPGLDDAESTGNLSLASIEVHTGQARLVSRETGTLILQTMAEHIEKAEQAIGNDLQALNQRVESMRNCFFDLALGCMTGNLKCPQLCFVSCKDHGIVSGQLWFKSFRLYFMCSYDFTPVSSCVRIKATKEWFKKVAPLFQKSLSVLQIAMISSSSAQLQALVSLFRTSLDGWLKECPLSEELVGGNQERNIELTPAMLIAVAIEALKPSNCGWLDEMVLSKNKGGEYAWVKKENVDIWKSS